MTDTIHPELRAFILFCIERQGSEWPLIYDEIARTAALRLYRGMGYSELKQFGLSLAVSDLDDLIHKVTSIAETNRILKCR